MGNLETHFPRLYAIVNAAFFASSGEICGLAEALVAGGCTLLQYRNKSGNARVMLEQARELKRLFGLDSSSSRRHPEGPRFQVNPRFQPGAAQPRAEGSCEGRNHSRSARDPALRLKNGYARDDAMETETFQIRRDVPPVRLIMNDRADLCLAAEFDGVHVGQEDLSPESVRKIIGFESGGRERWLGVSTHNPEQIREADLTSADYLAIGPVFPTSSKERPDPVVGLEGVRRARALTRKPLVAIGGITRANAASVIEAGADSVAVISDLLREPRKSAEEFLRVLR
jgi:thiamine-phosphate pyrophosphorylase